MSFLIPSKNVPRLNNRQGSRLFSMDMAGISCTFDRIDQVSRTPSQRTPEQIHPPLQPIPQCLWHMRSDEVWKHLATERMYLQAAFLPSQCSTAMSLRRRFKNSICTCRMVGTMLVLDASCRPAHFRRNSGLAPEQSPTLSTQPRLTRHDTITLHHSLRRATKLSKLCRTRDRTWQLSREDA